MHCLKFIGAYLHHHTNIILLSVLVCCQYEPQVWGVFAVHRRVPSLIMFL